MNRRKAIKTMIAGGLGLAATKTVSVIAQPAPIKIGLLTVKTGPLAQGGYQMTQGIQLFLKQQSEVLARRKVELLIADTAGRPAEARTKVAELVERDHVDVILGPFAAFELLAISDYVRQQQIPILTSATAEDITQRKVNPWIVRTSSSSGQIPHVMAHYSVNELKLKTMSTIANDFAFGHEQCGAFQRVFEDEGGKIVSKLWPPLVTPDFLPYALQLTKIDGVFNGLGGGNPIPFLKTYASLRPDKNIKMVGGWSFLDEPLLKTLGDEAIGVYTGHWYTPEYESESNKRYVAEMQKNYGDVRCRPGH